MLGAAIRTCEQCIFPVERDGADGALDGVVVEFDAAIVDEARQAFPARQGVTDGLGELALLADQPEFCTQPRLKGIDSRPALLLANAATPVGTAATAVFVAVIERRDLFQRLAGNPPTSSAGRVRQHT